MANVTIYSTPTCGYCNMTKDFLSDKDVAYTEINIAENQEEAQKMVEKTGQMGVPVTVIEEGGKEEIVIGFDQGRLQELLNV